MRPGDPAAQRQDRTGVDRQPRSKRAPNSLLVSVLSDTRHLPVFLKRVARLSVEPLGNLLRSTNWLFGSGFSRIGRGLR
jgi:hypothetical protein